MNHDTSLTFSANFEHYKIQPNDVLDIDVKSLSEESEKFFEQSSVGNNMLSNSGMALLQGYLVSPSGKVKLPIVGEIVVSGFTLSEADSVIQARLEEFFNVITVNTKLLSYRVTVLGEVRQPGSFSIFQTKNNIFQVLGQAGDLTDLADRKRIKVMRESGDGFEMKLIDVTTTGVMDDPMFFILPNDLIYVEPVPAKIFRWNSGNITLGLSVLTSLLLILNLTRGN